MTELVVRELRLRTYESVATVAASRARDDALAHRHALPSTTVERLAARHSRRRPSCEERDLA